LAGFGSTVARPDGLYGRFGIWGKDAEDQSSKYRELRNLVETVEEEALDRYLTGGSFGYSPTTRLPKDASSGEALHRNYFPS
jgi:hypothetical protein